MISYLSIIATVVIYHIILYTVTYGCILLPKKEKDILDKINSANQRIKIEFDSVTQVYHKKGDFILVSAIKIFSLLTPYCLIVCGKRYRVLIFTKTYCCLRKNSKMLDKVEDFDLIKAKKEQDIIFCTRDNKNVRILCFDAKGNYPIVALVEDFYQEISYQYTSEGKRDKCAIGTDKSDLMIKTKKQVYKIGNRVKLPFGETGTISQINGLNYIIRIRDSNFDVTGNRTNQKVNFLEHQIKKENI